MRIVWGIYINKTLLDVFETLEELLDNIKAEIQIEDIEALQSFEIRKIENIFN